MSVNFELNAEKRDDLGKGASRRLRREGKVPGIVYGADKEPQSISLSANDLGKSLAHEAFYSHLLDLNLDGNTTQVVLRDLQRHPFKPVILHVDLQWVDLNKPIHVHAPIHFINEDTCPGVKAGGLVTHEMIEVEISCLPAKIPEFLEVDLSGLNVGDSVHLSEMTLPEGVSIPELARGEGHDLSVVSVHGKKGGDEDVEEAEAGEEEAGGEE